MGEFNKYKRVAIAEMREVSDNDRLIFSIKKRLLSEYGTEISISEADLKNGSPKKGDMIARNPKNHNDQWLVAEKYFKENFEKKLKG